MKDKKISIIKNKKLIFIVTCIICIAIILLDKCGILLDQISAKQPLSRVDNSNIIRMADNSTVDSYNDFMLQDR